MRFRINRKAWDLVREYSRMDGVHSSKWVDRAVEIYQQGGMEEIEIDDRTMGGGDLIGYCTVDSPADVVRTAVRLRLSHKLKNWHYRYSKDLLDTMVEIEAFYGRQINYEIAQMLLDRRIEGRKEELDNEGK